MGHELASKTSGPHLFASPASQLIRSLTTKLDSSSLAWTRSPSVRCSWWPGTGGGSLAKASWHIQAPFYCESTLRWPVQNASLLLRPHSARKLVKGVPAAGARDETLPLSLCSQQRESPVQGPGRDSRTHVCLPGGDDETDSPNLFPQVSWVS